jgi:hypothetical protein
MLFIFSTPVLIRHLWQLEAFVLLYWCLIHALPLASKKKGKEEQTDGKGNGATTHSIMTCSSTTLSITPFSITINKIRHSA